MCMHRVLKWSGFISSVCFYLAAINGIMPGCMCTDKAFINKDNAHQGYVLCLEWDIKKMLEHAVLSFAYLDQIKPQITL